MFSFRLEYHDLQFPFWTLSVLLRFFNAWIGLLGILITGPAIQFSQNCWLEIFPFLYLSTYSYLNYDSFYQSNFNFHIIVSQFSCSLPQLSCPQGMYSFLLRVHKSLCTDPDSGRFTFICYPYLSVTAFHTMSLQYILHHHFVL